METCLSMLVLSLEPHFGLECYATKLAASLMISLSVRVYLIVHANLVTDISIHSVCTSPTRDQLSPSGGPTYSRTVGRS